MSKNKMNKDIVPENFTLGLVSVDVPSDALCDAARIPSYDSLTNNQQTQHQT